MQRNKLNLLGAVSPTKFRRVDKLRNYQSRVEIKPNQTSKFLPPCNPQQEKQKATTHNSQLSQQLDPLQGGTPVQMPIRANAIEAALREVNFRHHDQQNCMCQKCNCGRHLCKLNVIRPQFHRQTSYSQHYRMKQASKSLVIVSQETPALKGESLVKKSSYSKEFTERKSSKIDLQKREDHLKLSGPSQTITSYANQFYSRPGLNQHVKSTDKHTIGSSPFKGKTTYEREFSIKNMQRHTSLKSADNLKNGGLWTGKSVYSMKFKNPNPEEYRRGNPLMSKSEKVLKNPEYLNRFSTTYRTNFTKKESPLCPVTKELRSNSKFERLKSLLSENSDFRGMNPQFKAIATSRHYYV